jgi:hypothetical protein
MRSIAQLIAALILATTWLTAGIFQPAQAGEVFAVDGTADSVDANPGDGVCADSLGRCTPRAAMMEANALSGTDLITFPAGTYTLTLTGSEEDAAATGDLDVLDDLTINGTRQASTTIDAAGLDRVFQVLGGTDISLSMSDLTITGGGGPIINGGGLTNTGIASLTRVTISDNTPGANGASGEALCKGGQAALTDTTFSGNSGWGVTNSGTLTVIGGYQDAATSKGLVNWGTAHISGFAFQSARLVNVCGDLTLERLAVTSGSDPAQIDNCGTLTLRRITASGMSGDAVYNHDIKNLGPCGTGCRGDLTVENASRSSAGGDGLRNDGDAQLSFVTLAGHGSYGLETGRAGATTLAGVPIADNASAACSRTVTSYGYNLDDDGSCGLPGTGDVSGADPLLGPLQDNVGPTLTLALLPGSPAIDAGGSSCPAQDLRGVTRPPDGDADGTSLCDIGAYEALIFTDVPPELWASPWILALYQARLTSGCATDPLRYCPTQTATRAQMSVYVLRGIHGPSYTPPSPPATQTFSHIDGQWAQA